ncbi:unnamed protein product [Caenorhabditis angaria]|uniref:Lipid-binding serum glycoprotein C-terminal domain-containing protein n=1 Tax=Caenorhabditis angaria TaxID=860376 RepID=A0A9P1MXN9_9PELO|nr:unnamed protein product [Caenorhabditis angaria]
MFPVTEKFIQTQFNEEVPKLKIPEINEKKHHFKLKTNTMDVIGYYPPEIGYKYLESGTTVTSNGGEIRFKGGFKVKFLFFVFHGSLTVVVGDMRMKTVLSSFMSDGKYQIRVNSCDIAINKMDIQSSGGLFAKIVNMFLSSVSNKIRRTINERACSKVQENINKLNDILRNSTTIDIGKRFQLNYELIKQPVYTSSVEFEMILKMIFDRKEFLLINREVDLSNQTSDSSMLEISSSSLFFNDLLDLAHQNNISKFEITKDNEKIASYLQTTCKPLTVCIGDFIPKLGQLYPNSFVDVLIHTKSNPYLKFTGEGIKLNMGLLVDIYINSINNNSGILARFLVTPSEITLNPVISKSKLFIDIEQGITYKIDKVFSKIGSITDPVLQTLSTFLDYATRSLIVGYFGKGFEIPKWHKLSIADPSKILTFEDKIFFDTDIRNL